VDVKLEPENPEAMPFPETILIEVSTMTVVDVVFKLLTEYDLPTGLKILARSGNKFVNVDNRNPDAEKELEKLVAEPRENT
jgi:hypothetical protein